MKDHLFHLNLLRKDLTEGTWGCTKAVDSAGNEFEVEDRITFSIDGTDSTFYKDYNSLAIKS